MIAPMTIATGNGTHAGNGFARHVTDEVFVFPATVGQQGFWYLDQLAPGNPAYNIAVRFRLQGPLRVQALERALNEIVRRHESLRTTFAVMDGVPVQVVTPRLSIRLERDDLRGGSPEARREQAQQLAAAEARQSFDLTKGPLVRARLLCLDDDEHVLLVTIHHIVSDGWSIGVVTQELGILYDAYCRGLNSPLPELALQYGDVAVWQEQWLKSSDLNDQLAYWTRQLAGLPVLELPADRPRSAVQTFNGHIESVLLPRKLTDGLEALRAREKVTLFMLMLAAFKLLLQRYTSRRDVFVGSMLAGRSRVELEPLIGLFINPLVFGTDLSGDPPFLDLLTRVQETVLQGFANQEVPFERVVEAVQPKRDPSRHPVFQINFLLQRDFVHSFQVSGLTLTAIPSVSSGAIYDLNLFLVERAEGWRASCEYNTDLYESGTIRRLLGHFQTLLEGIDADPRRPISELPMLAASEERQLLREWNETGTEYPRSQPIHALFEEQAAGAPDAVAVLFEGRELTYGELNALANRLAHRLRGLGVGRGTLVGLCLDRSPELIIGLLGILKAGGAYVPLDPLYPDDRLAFMLRDTSAPVVLVHGPTAARLGPVLKQVGALGLDVQNAARAAQDADNPASGATAEDLAYVMYTSGSTGNPKGVLVGHRAVVRLVRNTNYCEFGPGEVFLHFAPLAFDASTFEIWGPLLNGCRLALLRPGPPAPDAVGTAIRRYGVTTLWLTAGLFHLFVDQQAQDLKPLRQLLAGGDVLSPPHVQKALASLRDGVLINGYGPTESTTFACCFRMTKSYAGRESVPIGRPISNTIVYVLDEEGLRPVPVGVPGELYIGGDGLARGYLNNPELTREKFVPDPFNNDPTARLYRTGDRVRYRDDGNLEFLGRFDTQVKILGHRIEPGEIEAALARQPDVGESVVVAREVAPGDKRLVAYVTKRNGQALDSAALRARLKATLPGCMVPSAIVPLDRLPLTPNGKVDRAALPAPHRAQPGDPGHVGPRDETESALVELWEGALGQGPVSVSAGFFDEGGDSLSAMSLLARIEQRFGKKVSLAGFLQAPTIEAVAANLRDEKWVDPETQVFPMQGAGTRPPLILVDAGPFHRPLVRKLGSDQPVFGVALPKLSALPREFTVKDIAADLVNTLCASPLDEPYYLAGWSFAGVMAYEMAQQLRSRGKEVALLILFDTNNPAYLRGFEGWRNYPLRLYLWIGKVLYHSWTARGMPLRSGWRHFRERLRKFQLKSLNQVRKPGDGPDESSEKALGESWKEQYRAAADYQPGPCECPVALVRSRALQTGWFRDPRLGWGEVARGGLQVYEMPGEHDAMFLEPVVERLASVVNDCLRRATAAVAPVSPEAVLVP
jgi:aspartate racemase